MIREAAKNIPNRREEANGDLLNIRRRFPLSAFGYFFLADFRKIVDMCRKVSLSPPGDEATAYDASCLIVVELHKSPPRVVVHEKAPPEDLRADRFFATMLDRLLTRAQADDHPNAGQLWLAAHRGPAA